MVNQVFYIMLAMSAGLGSAVQSGLIGALSRARGPVEASFISVLASICAMATVLGYRAVRGSQPSLPAPFDGVYIYIGVILVAGTALAISIRGVDAYLAVAGLFGFLYLFAAAFVAPRAGIALFAASITAGTMIGAVALDHFGSFGGAVVRINLPRVIGVAMLLAGVALIRGR